MIGGETFPRKFQQSKTLVQNKIWFDFSKVRSLDMKPNESGLPPINLGWSACSKVNSFANISHKPGGGNVKLPKINQKFKTSGIESQIKSRENINHISRGGQKRILCYSLKWLALPKVGSFQNLSHRPGGGNVIIKSYKTQWNQSSKVNSLENIHFSPRRFKRNLRKSIFQGRPFKRILFNVFQPLFCF